MDRWQYRHFVTRPREFTRIELAFGADKPTEQTGDSLTNVLARWGDEGWELVGTESVEGGRLLFVFKRPTPAGEPEVGTKLADSA
jgi:hypothetical protein